jgi:hypothetical protein
MAPFEGLFFVIYSKKWEFSHLKCIEWVGFFRNSRKTELGAVLAITHSIEDGSYSKPRLTRGR